jgi:hypothetical protein
MAGSMARVKNWVDTVQVVVTGAIALVVVFAWYDQTFHPDMTYMCRHYIGAHPVGGDAYLDADTLDRVMECRLDQRRYQQTFRPIRTCTADDIDYVKSNPNNRVFCEVR